MRIVPQLAAQLVASWRDFTANIENASRISGGFDILERGARFGAPNMWQKWRAQSSVAVLARECTTQSARQLTHVEQRAAYAIFPTSAGAIDQGIHMNMRVPCVTENYAGEFCPVECRTHAAHVFGKAVRWHASILDELH